jgi:hypothetical protein
MHLCGDWKHDAPLAVLWLVDQWGTVREFARAMIQACRER